MSSKTKKKNNNDNSSRKKEVKKKVVVEQNNEASTKSPYFGYGVRLSIFLMLFLVFFWTGIFALVSSIVVEEEQVFTYREKGIADFEVCYKKDDFYQGKCFNKNQNMKFIASLIDKIKLDFNYQFDIDNEANLDFTYDIVGKLVISDSNSNKIYFEKEYPLLTEKKVELNNAKNTLIDEKIDIDYGKYNSLANQFNRSYGLNSVSRLLVYMNIHKQSKDSSVAIDNQSLSYVTIPLSEKAIDIALDSNQVDTTRDVVKKVNVSLKSTFYAVIAGVLLILSIIFVIKLIRLLKKAFVPVSKYDKYIAKLLREYDRLIGEAKNMVSLDDKEVVYFKKFGELVDVHDHLGLPIMYYNVTNHVKSYFYIVHGQIVYLYVAKAVDIEN